MQRESLPGSKGKKKSLLVEKGKGETTHGNLSPGFYHHRAHPRTNRFPGWGHYALSPNHPNLRSSFVPHGGSQCQYVLCLYLLWWGSGWLGGNPTGAKCEFWGGVRGNGGLGMAPTNGSNDCRSPFSQQVRPPPRATGVTSKIKECSLIKDNALAMPCYSKNMSPGRDPAQRLT